jgi:ATP-dependent Lhr-like helicase
MGREEMVSWLGSHTPLDALAAGNLADYLLEQKGPTGGLPSDNRVVVERFRDELGDWRVCLLTPFGARIHAPWAMALQRTLERDSGFAVQVMYTDDGIALLLADGDDPPGLERLLPDPETVQELVTEQLADSALFAGLFRENAARALLMPRRTGRERRPLWAQRLKSQQLLATVRRYSDFPVVMETYRQCLSDRFDLPGLKSLLTDIQARRMRVFEVETPYPSPFARSLVFAYVAAFIYEQDAPLAERRVQALTLDRRLLGELLGQDELRSLIDPRVLVALEAELQHLSLERRARNPDGLQDILRRLGDFSFEELRARCAEDPAPWLKELRRQRRAVALRVAGEERWIAAEDAALYRDGLGAMPPAGLPEAFLESAEDPLPRLLARYARTHGPFLTEGAARRFGLLPAQIEPSLRLLEAEGRLLSGEIRPGGVLPEWCDQEVLRHLRRRTLAGLRRSVAPVEAAALARFLPRWQGLVGEPRARKPLLEAVRRLAGLALPWSDLSRSILPARVPDFRGEQLDLLCASAAVVWVGCGALGPRDGRIALYPREAAAALLEPDEGFVPGCDIQRAILGSLESRGACFYMELEQAARTAVVGLSTADFDAALWDLVWAGRITNDTFAPLRDHLGGAGRHGGRRKASIGGRWSLADRLVDPATSPTARLLSRAWTLLERYGVVSREVAAAESLTGGFAGLYQVLKELEQTGKVRRGFFVEGLSGAQFAHPGAVERLRACREDVDGGLPEDAGCRLVCACDPANPYGALLPWPDVPTTQTSPRRSAGAWVVLKGGEPIVYLAPGGRQLLTFGRQDPAAQGGLLEALQLLGKLPPGARRGAWRLDKIDGVPVLDSPLRPALLEAGFAADYRGLVLERRFA